MKSRRHPRSRTAYRDVGGRATPEQSPTWTYWPRQVPTQSAAAILYLAAVGSVIGFVAYYYVLQRIGPARVSLVTLVTPVIALLLGQALNGDTPLLPVRVGSVLILSGLALNQRPRMPGAPPRTTRW